MLTLFLHSIAIAAAAANLPLLTDQDLHWGMSRAEAMKAMTCEAVTESLSSTSAVDKMPGRYSDSVQAVCKEPNLGVTVLADLSFQGDKLVKIQVIVPLSPHSYAYFQHFGGKKAAEDLLDAKRDDTQTVEHQAKGFNKKAFEDKFAADKKASFETVDAKLQKLIPDLNHAAIKQNIGDFFAGKTNSVAWSYEDPVSLTTGMASYSKDSFHNVLVTIFPLKK